MRANECLEKGTQKRLSKKHYDMLSSMDGGWKSAAVMPGGKSTVQIMTKIAGVGNSALQVSGVRQLTHQIMANKFGEWLIIVLRVRQSDSRVLK